MNKNNRWKLGGSLFIVIAILCGVFFPAAAAGNQPTLSVIGVVANDTVQFQGMYLPAETVFSVRMGVAGTKGAGAPIVANVKSSWDGTIFASVEISAKVMGAESVDLRLEGGGIVLVATFDNSASIGFSPHMVLSTPGTGVFGTTATAGSSGVLTPIYDRIWVEKVQKGGYVVAAIYNLEKNVDFMVYISEAGMPYRKGYIVSWLKLTDSQTEDILGTFEIPFQLRFKPQLMLHVVGPGYEYVGNFANADQ